MRLGLLSSSAPVRPLTVGVFGSFGVTTTGAPVPAVSITGSLPAGVKIIPGHGPLAGREELERANLFLVPLDEVTRVTRSVGPLSVNHSGQLPSVTLSFNLEPVVLRDQGFGAAVRALTEQRLAEAISSFSLDALAGEVPKAFVVLTAPASAQELMAWVAERVAGYKYPRLVELVRAHRTTLVFVNTRRMAERAARNLAAGLHGLGVGGDLITAVDGKAVTELDAVTRSLRDY